MTIWTRILTRPYSDWKKHEISEVLNWLVECGLYKELVARMRPRLWQLNLPVDEAKDLVHEQIVKVFQPSKEQAGSSDEAANETRYDPNRYNSRLKGVSFILDAPLPAGGNVSAAVLKAFATHQVPLDSRSASVYTATLGRRWYVDDFWQDFCIVRQRLVYGPDEWRVYTFGNISAEPIFSVDAAIAGQLKGGVLPPDIEEAFRTAEAPLDLDKARVTRRDKNRWEVRDGTWRYRLAVCGDKLEAFAMVHTRKVQQASVTARVFDESLPNGATLEELLRSVTPADAQTAVDDWELQTPMPGVKRLLVKDGEPVYALMRRQPQGDGYLFHYQSRKGLRVQMAYDVVPNLENGGELPQFLRRAFEAAEISISDDVRLEQDIPGHWCIVNPCTAYWLVVGSKYLSIYDFNPLAAYLYSQANQAARQYWKEMFRIAEQEIDDEHPHAVDSSDPFEVALAVDETGQEFPEVSGLMVTDDPGGEAAAWAKLRRCQELRRRAREARKGLRQAIERHIGTCLHTVLPKSQPCMTEARWEALDLSKRQGLSPDEAARRSGHGQPDGGSMRKRLHDGLKCFRQVASASADEVERWAAARDTIQRLTPKYISLEATVEREHSLRLWVEGTKETPGWEGVARNVAAAQTDPDRREALEALEKWLGKIGKASRRYGKRRDEDGPGSGAGPDEDATAGLPDDDDSEEDSTMLFDRSHLTEWEIAEAAAVKKDTELPRAIRLHLEACPICRLEVTELRAIEQSLPEMVWRSQPEELKRQLLADVLGKTETDPVSPSHTPAELWARFVNWLQGLAAQLQAQNVQLAPAMAFESTEFKPIVERSADDAFELRIVKEGDDLVIWLDGPQTLAGRRVRLTAGDWQATAALEQSVDDPDYAMAIVRLTAEARQALRPGATLNLEGETPSE